MEGQFQTLSQKTLSEVSESSQTIWEAWGGDSRGHGRPEWRVNFQTLSQKTLSEVSVLSNIRGGMSESPGVYHIASVTRNRKARLPIRYA